MLKFYLHSVPDKMEKFQVDIKKMMQDTLPVYITNCLMAAGFDDAEVIAAMDTSENPGNLIPQIENYIERRFHSNSEYISNPTLLNSQLPFKFPPVHKIKIHNFVQEVKKVLAKTRQQSTT